MAKTRTRQCPDQGEQRTKSLWDPCAGTASPDARSSMMRPTARAGAARPSAHPTRPKHEGLPQSAEREVFLASPLRLFGSSSERSPTEPEQEGACIPDPDAGGEDMALVFEGGGGGRKLVAQRVGVEADLRLLGQCGGAKRPSSAASAAKARRNPEAPGCHFPDEHLCGWSPVSL